jgi:RimJ/RimL family protein N-acetyltransferase
VCAIASQRQNPLKIVETPQLSLREMQASDAPFYLELLSDPDFKSNIGDRGVLSEGDALRHMRDKVFASYQAHGFGMYLVTRKSDGAAIGMAGLVKRDFLDYVDVGYAFLPRGRGQGFATEAAAVCVELARERFGLKRLAAITDPGNAASIRVLEKLAFINAGSVQFPDDGEMCAYFLLDL